MYVVERMTLKNGEKHPGADRLKVWKSGGVSIITDLSHEEGEFVFYFPEDGVLHPAFAQKHNLVKNIDPDTGKNLGGMFEPNLRIRPISIRGVKTSGFVMKAHLFEGYSHTQELFGQFEDGWVYIGNEPVAKKFTIPTSSSPSPTKLPSKVKTNIQGFDEHYDTQRWRGFDSTKHGNAMVVVTEKIHGTSGRTGYVKNMTYQKKTLNWFQNVWYWLLSFFSKVEWLEKVEEYKMRTGSRQRVLSENDTCKWFEDVDFRMNHSRVFEGKLKPGETVYYEIYGFTHKGKAISVVQNLNKVPSLKKFFRKELMDYSYGCNPKESRIGIYRITQEQLDGSIRDLGWLEIQKRCEQLGVETVPVLGIFYPEVDELSLAEVLNENEYLYSTLDHGTLMEGLCIRLDYPLHHECYKFKFHAFKELEMNRKETTGEKDMEEEESEG